MAKTGRPKGTYKFRDDADIYVVQPNGCWNSKYALDGKGYTQLWRGVKLIKTHLYFFEKYKGKLPEGMQIDHLCRNKICCNPEHLEAVTIYENIRRQYATQTA